MFDVPFEATRLYASRMTWWQTLTITAVPALLTLLLTQYFEGRRRQEDHAARKEERKAEEAIRVQTRYEALEDAFRDRRVEAHAEFLRAARDVAHHLGILIAYLEKETNEEVMLDLELMGRYTQAYSAVQILAGETAKAAAADVDTKIDDLIKDLRRWGSSSGPPTPILQGDVKRLRNNIQTYVWDARADEIDPSDEWADRTQERP